jgi:hypothetical protein
MWFTVANIISALMYLLMGLLHSDPRKRTSVDDCEKETETGDSREESASTVIKNQVEFLPLYIRCFNAQGLVNK